MKELRIYSQATPFYENEKLCLVLSNNAGKNILTHLFVNSKKEVCKEESYYVVDFSELENEVILHDSVRVEIFEVSTVETHALPNKKLKIFQFWFHTSFVCAFFVSFSGFDWLEILFLTGRRLDFAE